MTSPRWTAASPDLPAQHSPALADALNEAHRLREALRLIATGHISPSMSYAQRALDGEDPREALAAEIKASRARR